MLLSERNRVGVNFMKSKQQNVCNLVEKLTGVVSLFSVFAFLLKFTPLCRFLSSQKAALFTDGTFSVD